MHTLLFVGGGSIGHIAPALAVWEELRDRSSNLQAHFVCSMRAEDQKFLRNAHVPFTAIKAPRIGLSLPLDFVHAMLQAKALLNNVKPAVIFSKGGSVSVPVCLAAHWMGIPIVLHESDAVMGYANRIVARWARHICLGFPPNHQHHTLHSSLLTFHFTGNPIRPEVTRGTRTEGLRITGLTGERPTLLIMGGTQGAKIINETIEKLLPKLLQHCDIVHLTGTGKELHVKQDGYWAHPFVTSELPHLYAIADIAISRAGAESIAELAANAIPTILVPLRGVGHDHQQYNAEVVAKKGGCIILQQRTLSSTILPTIERLFCTPNEQKTLGRQLHALHAADAAKRIANILLEMLA